MKTKIKLPEIQDFFDAVKDIRVQGIAVDPGDGVEQFVRVDIPSIANDIGCEQDDSLEAILYPPYEEIVTRGPGFEIYADAYNYYAGNKEIDEVALPWLSLRTALEDFLRDAVTDVMIKRHAELRDAHHTRLGFGLDSNNRVMN